MIAWLLISFFVLLFLGVPIAMSLGLAAMGGILFLDGGNVVTIAQRMFEGMNSWALLAIPLYTFAGFTMSKGGISDRLMNFCYSIVGHIYGGLAHVNVLSSMIFAGISGSAVADTAGVSGMFMPTMIKQGYSKKFTVSVTAISSTIGIIIPPSIPMVVIAGICGLSTGKLFLGGIIPGILIAVCLMAYCILYCVRHGEDKKRINEAVDALRSQGFLRVIWSGIPALLTPVIILGGIYSGKATPTEAACISVFYALFVSLCIYRTMKVSDLLSQMKSAVKSYAPICLLIAFAIAFGRILSLLKAPALISDLLTTSFHSPYTFLIALNLCMLIMGMFMDTASAIAILGPILLASAKSFGIGGIHFGIILVTNLAVGLVSPPVGINLFVAAPLVETSAGKLGKQVLAPCAFFLLALILITFIPQISECLL